MGHIIGVPHPSGQSVSCFILGIQSVGYRHTGIRATHLDDSGYSSDLYSTFEKTTSQPSIGEFRWGLAHLPLAIASAAEAVAADVKPFQHFLIALGARESVPWHFGPVG
jgi:hypothetical protein